MVKIVCLSDTHNMIHKVDIPDGDILIHAGDATGRGTIKEVIKFNAELRKLPHRHIIYSPGNHDFLFQQEPYFARSLLDNNIICLMDDCIEIDDIKIYCSPWQPWYNDWAFNLQRGNEINRYWKLIPEDTDILVTHGPPAEILDGTLYDGRVGCWDLQCHVLYRVRPRYHVFGHIHEAYGIEEQNNIIFMNVSACDVNYEPTNPPMIIEYG